MGFGGTKIGSDAGSALMDTARLQYDMSDEPTFLIDPSVINHVPRAVVYLGVDWSMPERRSREIVLAALDEMSAVDFAFFALQEDDENILQWLALKGWRTIPLGNGSLLWFENGNLIASEIYPAIIGSKGISSKTRTMWPSSSRVG